MRPVAFLLTCALAAALPTTPSAAAQGPTPLALTSARVSLDGTSNVHDFSASTTTVRLVAIEIGGASGVDLLDGVLQPGGLKGFEVTIPAATLTSAKEDLDKNMHKALKVQAHADIRFRLRALEPVAGGYHATGVLTIAGVEKEVTLNMQAQRRGAALAVTGSTELLMTDYGITPPKMMMGMLRTDPKVTIRLELLLGGPAT